MRWLSEDAVPPSLLPSFKLAGASGDGRHAYANENGAFIGRGVPLLECDRRGRFRPRDTAVLERLLMIGYGSPFDLGWRAPRLRQIADALNDGDLALASIALVHMQLPPLPNTEWAHAMAKADGLLAKENPEWADEPRVPAGNPDGGQWTDEDASAAGDEAPAIRPAAAQVDETQARKERFVDAHLADTIKLAERLGIPVENILGLAALESRWGEARFAREGNNFFGIHYPAPFATGYLQARGGPAKVATFASYADSLRSFETIAGSVIRDVKDPREFAAALWQSGKFGVGNPTYVRDVASTIRGLRPVVSRRRV